MPKYKNTTITLLTLAMAALFAWQERADASSGSQQVSGYVRDEQGNPIVGINVIGDDYVGDILTSRGPTDVDGYYDVDADSDGNYRITVSCEDLTKLGYACLAPASVSLAGEAIHLDWTVHPAANPLQITNTALPKGTVGMDYRAQLGASGGKSPYTWQLASDSPGFPQGLEISTTGLISGTPRVNDLFTIKVKVTDAESGGTNKVFTITINPKPLLSEPTWRTNQFSMRLTGASNQNYTIQGATDLMASNWISLFMTNNAKTNSFIVTDPNATKQQTFHRVWIGP